MKATERFIDTNVLLYLLSGNTAKADRAQQTLAPGGTISVQVLNEFASVALRKLRMPFVEIRDAITTFRQLCRVVPLDVATHDAGLRIAERYGLSFYDALLIGSATLAGCTVLFSEDLHNGQTFPGGLVVRNPFL